MMKKIPIPLIYVLAGLIVLIGFSLAFVAIGLIPMLFAWLASFDSFNNFIDNYLGKILLGIAIIGVIIFIIALFMQGIRQLSKINEKYNFIPKIKSISLSLLKYIIFGIIIFFCLLIWSDGFKSCSRGSSTFEHFEHRPDKY